MGLTPAERQAPDPVLLHTRDVDRPSAARFRRVAKQPRGPAAGDLAHAFRTDLAKRAADVDVPCLFGQTGLSRLTRPPACPART